MTDMYKPIGDGPDSQSASRQDNSVPPPSGNDAGKALLAGVLGGIVSAAGYLIYSRLPDEHKERLHQQVRSMVEARVNELRSKFNV